MKCEDVYRCVRQFVSNHDYKLENVYVHAWEADVFSVTSSLYAYEIEVKISRSDFFADFKKPKHHFFKSYKKGFGILNEGQSWMRESWVNTSRYPDLNNFLIEFTNIKAQQFNHKSSPNKFWYACPKDLVSVSEVPEYAGLIYVGEFGSPKVIKKAPFLHKDPINYKEMLFSKYFNRCNDLEEKVRNLEWQVERLKTPLPIFS